MHVAHSPPWFIGERRVQVRVDSLEDPACGPAESWIAFVSCLRQRCCCCLSKKHSSTTNRILVLGFWSEFVQIRGIIVFCEQPEQCASCMGKRRRFPIPSVFEKPQYGWNRSCRRDVGALLWNGEHALVPDSVHILRQCNPERRSVCVWQRFRVAQGLIGSSNDFLERAVLHRPRSVFENPADGIGDRFPRSRGRRQR